MLRAGEGGDSHLLQPFSVSESDVLMTAYLFPMPAFFNFSKFIEYLNTTVFGLALSQKHLVHVVLP